MLSVAVLAVAFAGTANTASSAKNATLPNLIYAMIDDWGWYDVGFRNPLIQTPVIDSLVEQEAALLEVCCQLS